MPIMDRREIEFDAEALVLAISASLRAAQGFGLPAMCPVGARCYPQDGQIDVLYGSKQAPQAVRMEAEALGALLVSYCIRSRIPMPRQSDKGVRIEANSVILAFRTTYSKAPPTELMEATTRPAEPIRSWGWIEPGKVPAK